MADLNYDVRRGHAYVKADSGRVIAQLADMGGACAILAEGDMTPEEARLLGHALISWSAWRRRITPQIDHYRRTSSGEGAVNATAARAHDWSDVVTPPGAST